MSPHTRHSRLGDEALGWSPVVDPAAEHEEEDEQLVVEDPDVVAEEAAITVVGVDPGDNTPPSVLITMSILSWWYLGHQGYNRSGSPSHGNGLVCLRENSLVEWKGIRGGCCCR